MAIDTDSELEASLYSYQDQHRLENPDTIGGHVCSNLPVPFTPARYMTSPWECQRRAVWFRKRKEMISCCPHQGPVIGITQSWTSSIGRVGDRERMTSKDTHCYSMQSGVLREDTVNHS